jgi:hypothetical protein
MPQNTNDLRFKRAILVDERALARQIRVIVDSCRVYVERAGCPWSPKQAQIL